MAAITPIIVDCPYCGRPIECTANLEPGDLVTQDTVTVNVVVDYDHTCPKRICVGCRCEGFRLTDGLCDGCVAGN
jgi:hypothetical protein